MGAKRLANKLIQRFYLDQNLKDYISANQKRWSADRFKGRKAVILADIYDFYPIIHYYALAGNMLADRLNARLESFFFDRGAFGRLGIPHRRLQSLYASFGAKLGLSFANAKKHRQEAAEFTDRVWSGLKTKQDVLNISVEGEPVGIDIYDTYLRTGVATVDLRDPLLKEMIREAYLIVRACKDYLEENDVKAVFTSHWAYNAHAILIRMALRKNIPVFHIGGVDVVTIREITSMTPDPIGYTHFKQSFDQLSEETKPKAREKARELLEIRFQGKLDSGTRYLVGGGKSGLTGYTGFTPERKLKDTGRPRALVLLSCFFDSPHGYRDLLFPDFWEWANFVLEHASQTPFDWYVKPHPSALPGNEAFVEQLARKYPKINFLDVRTSNKQLVEEGVSAMFTLYGTAGHEFAYMGVPVVNAGDNPHITYDFNLHPKTVDEFKGHIYSADRLKVNLDKSKIEECVYMYYLHYKDTVPSLRIDLDVELAKFGADVDDPKTFKYLMKMDLEPFFESYFSRYFRDTREAAPSSSLQHSVE